MVIHPLCHIRMCYSHIITLKSPGKYKNKQKWNNGSTLDKVKLLIGRHYFCSSFSLSYTLLILS
jgi:hypothetical protein